MNFKKIVDIIGGVLVNLKEKFNRLHTPKGILFSA